MAPFDMSFDTWRALARIDFPFVTCRTRRSIHGSHDLFQNFMKIYSFHHMSHASIDTCSRRDFSSFSRGPREHRCVASVDRTCAAHEPSHVAHVAVRSHVRGSCPFSFPWSSALAPALIAYWLKRYVGSVHKRSLPYGVYPTTRSLAYARVRAGLASAEMA